jgi:hypothetical protein
LLLERRGLGLAAREINLQEDEVFVGVFLELGFGEDLTVQPDAPASPVRSGKVHQQEFLVGFGLFLSLLVIGLPAWLGPQRGRQGETEGHRQEKRATMYFHPSIFEQNASERKPR